MAHKYLIDLTDEEQGYLHDVIRKGKTTARRVARAHVLLRAATGATDEDIAQTLHLGIASVHRIRQRFVDEGLTVLSTNSCGYLSTNSCGNRTGMEYESADGGAG